MSGSMALPRGPGSETACSPSPSTPGRAWPAGTRTECRQAALIRHTDDETARPDQLDFPSDAGMQELEPFGKPGGRGHLETSATRRQIDHRAVDHRFFRIDDELAHLGHHALRPDAGKSAIFAQNSTCNA